MADNNFQNNLTASVGNLSVQGGTSQDPGINPYDFTPKTQTVTYIAQFDLPDTQQFEREVGDATGIALEGFQFTCVKPQDSQAGGITTPTGKAAFSGFHMVTKLGPHVPVLLDGLFRNKWFDTLTVFQMVLSGGEMDAPEAAAIFTLESGQYVEVKISSEGGVVITAVGKAIGVTVHNIDEGGALGGKSSFYFDARINASSVDVG